VVTDGTGCFFIEKTKGIVTYKDEQEIGVSSQFTKNTFYQSHFTGSNYDDHTYMKYEYKRKLLKVRFMVVVLHFLLPY
jgi:hypothetical protein